MVVVLHNVKTSSMVPSANKSVYMISLKIELQNPRTGSGVLSANLHTEGQIYTAYLQRISV